MPRLPNALRTELTDTVERILAPDLDLQALTREMDDASGRIRTRSWIAATAASIEQVTRVNEALRAITEYEPDLTLLTADAGSPVYMNCWWLRRELTDEGTARTTSTSTSSRTTTPRDSTTTRGRRPRCWSTAAPSSRTQDTEPRRSRTAAWCCARRPTGTGSGSATDRYFTADPWDGSLR